MSKIKLTDQQQRAINTAVTAIAMNQPLYRIGGFAGTGKTSVAKYIVEKMNNRVICCAFTGKAACRLREKGLDIAQTIHRAIYNYDPVDNTFYRKSDVDGSCFLIDEGSMISTPLWNDIISFGKPVIMLGDPGQLEPIGGDPRLMHKPDMVLDQIHRQAMNSGIIQFATDIRLGNKIKKQYKDVKFMPQVMTKELLGSDIIICGFNSTRVRANEVCRRHLGHTGLICPGEPIVILKNNYHYQLFNGQIITVKQVGESSKTCTEVICDIDGIDRPVLLLNEQFGCPTTKTSPTRRIALADYGYCLTTHKSQGSEWGKVMVIDEQCSKWDAARWRYTAITRAADELIYVGLR